MTELAITRGPHRLTESKPCAFERCDSYDRAAWAIAAKALIAKADELAGPEDGAVLAMLHRYREAAEQQGICIINCDAETRAWVSVAALAYRYVRAWASARGVTVDLSDLGIPPLIPGGGGTLGDWFDRLEGAARLAVIGLALLLLWRLFGGRK